MRFSKFNRMGLLVLASSAGLVFSACNGGSTSSGSSASSSSGVTTSPYPSSVYDYTNGDFLVNIGGNEYQDLSNSDIVLSEGGNLYYDINSGSYEFADSTSGQNKDTDLQKATVQKQNITARAQVIANKFQMSLNSSVQLVQLSDRVGSMMQQGQMTANDRVAVANSALSIAGVTPDEVNQAISQGLGGNETAAAAVLAKAAKNLGMPSASNLRDQLLPALGVQIQ